ncbi:AzlC family ABC transporter permease [Loigolactobacillus bifermentans]|uniref:Branched-chain amino acid transporter n=1 Tax=Loigolactobacillus bifermentans DSM 20003 TaxID=1423726 RepID=A0A0R1GGA0_9LACO|nr:AzlC family ABC transporter permease [Loigolactobacillus bifermentans]KRK33198.1 branched-chain amino acid transporter [Loigolactobacillus bifermentans DSM 20003]
MTTTFQFAFKKSVPIMFGFIFLGISYGISMHQAGFNFLYPTLMAMTIFGGSVEFLIANLLTKAFDPWNVLILTLIINSRHLFYGLTMLGKYRHTGWRQPLLIFGMCDESFSINATTTVPKTVDAKNFMLWVTALNYCYWVLGAMFGGLFGSWLKLDLPGLSFVMTALFIVLALEQTFKKSNRASAALGFVVPLIWLRLVGATLFLPLSLITLVIGYVGTQQVRRWHA